MNRRHAMSAWFFKLRCRGRRHRPMRERSMLRVHQHREELQIIAERRARREFAQPYRAPRKHELAIGQTDAGYRRLRESFDLTGFEDSLRHGASLEDIPPSSPHARQPPSAFAHALLGLDALGDLTSFSSIGGGIRRSGVVEPEPEEYAGYGSKAYLDCT